jgi:hypothetical protein
VFSLLVDDVNFEEKIMFSLVLSWDWDVVFMCFCVVLSPLEIFSM